MSLSESKQNEQQKPPRWRQDFPINWESDHYITRRELAKFLALGSALLAGASAVLVTAGRLFRPQRFPRARIAVVSAIAQPGSLLFRYPTAQDPCILVRTAEGKLEAYSQVCTHLSCAVVYWKQENTLFCPCHRGYFSPDSGQPTAGPPQRRLPRVLLNVRGDDIYAVGIEV